MRVVLLVLGVLALGAASAGNDPEAWFRMGRAYDVGEGTEQNHAQALQWYLQAAEQGHVLAQYTAGQFYTLGTGSEVDYAAAAQWYRRAALQGHAGAQQSLAAMYDLGRGVAQDFGEAAAWYRRAAGQGASNAQLWLGNQYANGRGVPVDPIRATVWFSLAAESATGVDRRMAAASRDSIAAQLTEAQRAEAQERLRLCVQSGLSVCD